MSASASYVKDKTIYRGRPLGGQRQLKEKRVYTLLDSLGIEYLRLDHDPISTVDGCAEVERLLGISVCKNLFLCNRREDRFFLLMLPGGKRFQSKVFSPLAGSGRLAFAPAGYMEALLDITPGSVSVLGLMNDAERKVSLYIDGDILREEYVGCHPCVNTSSLKIKTKDITERFLPAVGHTFCEVHLP